jgi:hypothetical protein
MPPEPGGILRYLVEEKTLSSKDALQNIFFVVVIVAGLIYIFGQVKDALGIGQ